MCLERGQEDLDSMSLYQNPSLLNRIARKVLGVMWDTLWPSRKGKPCKKLLSSVVLAGEAGDDRGNPVSQVPKPLITEAKEWAKGDQLLEQKQQKRRGRERQRETESRAEKQKERKEDTGGGQGPLFKWELSKCTQEVLLVVALRTYPV